MMSLQVSTMHTYRVLRKGKVRGDKEDHHTSPNIIQKVPVTVIHLNVDGEQWRVTGKEE